MKSSTIKIILGMAAIILILGIVIQFQHEKIVKLKNEKLSIERVNVALHDSITYYQNRSKEWVAEKITIQSTLAYLEKNNKQLNSAQKELLVRIGDVNKENDIIAAALISANFKIDSLLVATNNNGNEITVDTINSTINFSNLSSKDTSFIFDINVNNVIPINSNIAPTLLFKKIIIPNKQFVEFHWKDEKKEGYPVSFTITNTNKYINVTGLDSYAIPSLNKQYLNPTGWQKVKNFFIKNKKNAIYLGLGATLGAGGYYLIAH